MSRGQYITTISVDQPIECTVASANVLLGLFSNTIEYSLFSAANRNFQTATICTNTNVIKLGQIQLSTDLF